MPVPFALALIYALMWAVDNLAGGTYMDRPIVCCPLVGFVLGDALTGLIIGGFMELAWMGMLSFAGVIDSEPRFGAIPGACAALAGGFGPGVALLVAIPFAYLGGFISSRYNSLNGSVMARWCDPWASEGNLKAICRYHLAVGFIKCLIMSAVMCLCGFVVLGPIVTALSMVPAAALNGLELAAGLLPAVALACMLNLLWDRRFVPLFFAGFALSAYVGASTPAVAVLAIALALTWAFMSKSSAPSQKKVSDKLPGEKYGVTKCDIRSMFWRSLPIEISYNTEREHNMLYVFSLAPILRKIYANDKDALTEALVRHMKFQNTTPQIEPLEIGVVASLEVMNAEANNTMGAAIEAAKETMMGPMGIVGDTLFHSGGFRVLSASLGAALALSGNPLGLVVYCLVFNIPNYLVHWFGIRFGFEDGTGVMELLAGSGLIQKISVVCCVVCTAVVGSLVALYVNVPVVTPLAQSATFEVFVQLMAGICPAFASLAAVWLFVWLLRSRGLNSSVLMLLLLVIGALFGMIGIL